VGRPDRAERWPDAHAPDAHKIENWTGLERARRLVDHGAARFGQDPLTADECARIARAFRAGPEHLDYADAAAWGCS
jgi:hypothetical protein